jgi:hypothetical protein
VYATFHCDVSTVDEAHREKLNLELYRKRKAAIGDRTATADVDTTDDEDLIGYEPTEPYYPAASSERQKWWLDKGPLYSL